MESYNYDNLFSVVGQEVSVSDDEGNEVFLTVAEVSKGALDGTSWEAFSVIYAGDKNFHIPQGNYTFKHSVFGVKKLFLIPNSETEYETVITREREAVAEQP